MKLTLTHYVDSAPTTVERNLGPAISTGLDAAADRVTDGRDETQTETIDQGLKVNRGLSSLDGSEIRVSGTDQLTTLEIAVPWSQTDAGTAKLWAAVRFATVIADEVRIAA